MICSRYYTYRALIGYLHCRLLPFTASPSHYHASDPDSFNPHNLARRYGEPTGDRATWSKRQYDALSKYVPPDKLWPASPHAIYRLADRYDLEEVKILAKRRISDDLEDWTARFSSLSLVTRTPGLINRASHRLPSSFTVLLVSIFRTYRMKSSITFVVTL